MTLQYRLLELFDAMLYSADFPEGFRAAVELRGFAMGRSRQPLSPSAANQPGEPAATLRCILADFGYVEAPPEGCPPRADLEPSPCQQNCGRSRARVAQKRALV